MYDTYIVKRTQIYLSDQQGRYLERRSRTSGRTVSQLIREAIEATYLKPRRADREEMVRIATSTAGAWKGFPETGKQYVEGIRGRRRLAKLHERP